MNHTEENYKFWHTDCGLNNNLTDFGISSSNAIASPPVQKSVDPFVLETKLSYSSHADYIQ